MHAPLHACVKRKHCTLTFKVYIKPHIGSQRDFVNNPQVDDPQDRSVVHPYGHVAVFLRIFPGRIGQKISL